MVSVDVKHYERRRRKNLEEEDTVFEI